MSSAAGAQETVRGVAGEVEAEVRRLIGYINDEVVPQVRRSSSVGLRAAAEQLQRMAEHLEHATPRAGRTGAKSTL